MTPKEIFKIKNSNLFDNIDSSLFINAYLDNRSKNRRKNNRNKNNKFKESINNKKQKINFYCGSPIFLNEEQKNKEKKYDFVPFDLFNVS